MSGFEEAVSAAPVTLPRPALKRMIALVRTLFALSRNQRYREYLSPLLPEVARFDPGHDAVMMGFDFHVTGEVPSLIEVNTNAGGGLLAHRAQHPGEAAGTLALPRRLEEPLRQSFLREMEAFSAGRQLLPRRLAILDEQPAEQFLYPEMLAFRELFTRWGIPALIVDPQELRADAEGVFHGDEPVDFIYNRHCDFYLESEPMAGLRAAYLARKLCLSPNPHVYGLLADKRRLALWTDRDVMASLGVSPAELDLLAETVPESRLMGAMARESLWQERKAWVFKPVDRFGSRGVLLGRKISRSRFEQLEPEQTLVQRLVEPSVTASGDEVMKTDFRLYAYRDRVLGVAARLYQGQVTNMRTPGGGFAPVHIR